MEATAVQEEDINASRPSGSIIQIKAISIDLNHLMFPNNMCADLQHNFSISEYAAEMKTKNPKACNPFSSDGFDDFEEQLPPLHMFQNLDGQSETTQDSAPLSKDVEKVPDSSNVSVADAEIETVMAVVNADTDVRESEEIADVGDTQANENVAHEGIYDNTDNVPVSYEFQKPESSVFSRILTEEKTKSANDERRIAETSNPVQNIDEVSVAEPVDSVELENVNNAVYDSDWSEGFVPSRNLLRRKVRKVRLLSDLLGENGSIKADPVREEDSSTTSSKSLGPLEAETSRSYDRILVDDVDTDYSDPQTKEVLNLEDEISSVRGTLAAKFDDLRTKREEAEATVKRSMIPSSGGNNKFDHLKRKIERNQSLAKKKRKASQVFDAFPSNKPMSKGLPKSVQNVRNDDSKRCNMFISKSFGSSSSVAGEPINSSHDYRETNKYRNDLSQTTLQNPNFSTINDWSSRTGPFTLDRYQEKIGSSRNADSVETDIVLKKKKKKKNNFRFGEGWTPPASGKAFLKNKQVLDLNERDTHNSSHELVNGSFPMPKERDFFRHCEQERLLENPGPSKLVSEQRKHRDGKAVMQGSLDDVPMEIVELMAKNQYERTLGNTGSHLGPLGTCNTMRTFPDFQDTRNTERPAIGYSNLSNFSSPNVRSGMSLQTGSAYGSQNGRNHYNMGQVERSLGIFGAFPQNRRQFSGPQHNEVVGPSMLPRFGLSGVQNFSVSAPESSHKGKTISDIKADELKKTQEEARLLLPEPVGFEFNRKLKGPLDPYANENIPALQLLSLMDERSPGTTFNGGTSRIFDHGQTPGFINGSMFLHRNHARESYGFGIGAHNADECSGQRPFTFSGSPTLESHIQDRSREKQHIFGPVSDVSNSGQTYYHRKDKQKTVMVYSESDDSQRIADMETESGQENITRLRTLLPNGICSLNRNPADFSTPEAGNEYTIDWRDIKFRKKRKHSCFYSKALKSSVHIDNAKQQKKEKVKARKVKGQYNEA